MSDWDIIAKAERNAWRSMDKEKAKELDGSSQLVDGLDAEIAPHVPGPFDSETEPPNLRSDE